MNLYRHLDDAYHHVTRHQPPAWLAATGAASLDELVATIRADRPDPTTSDRQLRTLVEYARGDRDAITVALYALAPKLHTALGRAQTDEFRHDALADLALVLVDSPLHGARLAARLVNRAHNRTHRAARSQHRRGTRNPIVVVPTDPERLARIERRGADPANQVAARVDLARFAHHVHTAVRTGKLSERAWIAYREHRLRRALIDGPACDTYQRTTAGRIARKLEPLIVRHLHAA